MLPRTWGSATVPGSYMPWAYNRSVLRSRTIKTFARTYRAERKRSRLSAVWVPTGGITANPGEDAHHRLIRAGFLRQSHSGIFHLLPLGKRVQDKLEGLIDHYMQELGASRVSLSTITSKDLWERSGRLSQLEPELFGFEDRKGAKYMLSPTHEEEITSLVARTVKSYKELPLRLYQITRKFRDEPRPRHGLLRSREFTMKDLYTFDISPEAALETYDKVRSAYAGVFGTLKLPVMVAKASSGDMGGDLSHEYHLPTPIGEDTVITCSSCDYTVNSEIAETRTDIVDRVGPDGQAITVINRTHPVKVWRGISKDRSTLVNAWYPGQLPDGANWKEIHDGDVSIAAIKSVIPELDASIDNPLSLWQEAAAAAAVDGQDIAKRLRLVNVLDYRLTNTTVDLLQQESMVWPLLKSGVSRPSIIGTATMTENGSGRPLNLLTARAGDGCPCCHGGVLEAQKALEVGHTFHLGTRYSEPLGATVTIPGNVSTGTNAGLPQAAVRTVHMQMGCHGIGVSRLIGAIVEHLADKKGLQWPRAIAPYEVVVVAAPDLVEEAVRVYDEITETSPAGPIGIDAVLDDRTASFVWKLKDADLVGYPVAVVLGKAWKESGCCELQCRQLGIKENVPLARIRRRVTELLERL